MAARALELRARLQASGLSQRAVARGIGVDSGHVSRVLRGIVASAPVQRQIEMFLIQRDQEQQAWLRRQLADLDGGRGGTE